MEGGNVELSASCWPLRKPLGPTLGNGHPDTSHGDVSEDAHSLCQVSDFSALICCSSRASPILTQLRRPSWRN